MTSFQDNDRVPFARGPLRSKVAVPAGETLQVDRAAGFGQPIAHVTLPSVEAPGWWNPYGAGSDVGPDELHRADAEKRGDIGGREGSEPLGFDGAALVEE